MDRAPLILTEEEHGAPLIEEEPPPPSSFHFPLLLNLYIGHFLARWGARMWEFSVGLYMINIWPDSLVLAAVYGVVESASTALLGPLVGEWVDKLSYLQVLRLWLLIQNLSFVVAGGSVIAILDYADHLSAKSAAFISLINISGAVAVLSSLAGTILIEREWVVVISGRQPPGALTKMNSVVRRIDLSCKLFAPVVSGFIISFISLTASAVTLALWNMLGVCLQYWLLLSVYNGFPELQEADQRRRRRRRMEEVVEATFALAFADHPDPDPDPEGETLMRSSSSSSRSSPSSHTNCNGIIRSSSRLVKQFLESPYMNAWRLYLKQDVVLPGVALALLFFTVLSFGSLMSAVLEWEGIPAYVIGIARGVSATIGIAATFVYPLMEARISTLRTGLWSIWSQWSCLVVCVGSILVSDRVMSAYLLMGGVAFSRLGLWMFDLSVIQLMQEEEDSLGGGGESHRCVVFGVQNSLQSLLDLLTYVMGILIPDPKEFWKLITMSFVVVTLAGVLYTLHVYRGRS
ncbi:solute carrier family 40 member 1-like isoform X2 [Andrographis paniculata]|uniref:solute carrier family 40 member 1-like isoform X2 n=1 Tax=Andrographis paniculata TaxID=175694 RepID=UPI0021E77F8D|nr:solute carrier family 40 member 1-like isoform X2 [Andrographis paniculata]